MANPDDLWDQPMTHLVRMAAASVERHMRLADLDADGVKDATPILAKECEILWARGCVIRARAWEAVDVLLREYGCGYAIEQVVAAPCQCCHSALKRAGAFNEPE